jgi:hypothetical protein
MGRRKIRVRLVVGCRPYNVETYVRIVDPEPQWSRPLLVTTASSTTTTQRLPREAIIVDANIAISVRIFYPLQGQFRRRWIAPMNILPRDKQIAVISALTEAARFAGNAV